MENNVAIIVKIMATRWSGRIYEDFATEAAKVMSLNDILFSPTNKLVTKIANNTGYSLDIVQRVVNCLIDMDPKQVCELARRSEVTLEEIEAELTASVIEGLFDE